MFDDERLPTNERTPWHASQLSEWPPCPDLRIGGTARSTSLHAKHGCAATEEWLLHASSACPSVSRCGAASSTLLAEAEIVGVVGLRATDRLRLGQVDASRRPRSGSVRPPVGVEKSSHASQAAPAASVKLARVAAPGGHSMIAARTGVDAVNDGVRRSSALSLQSLWTNLRLSRCVCRLLRQSKKLITVRFRKGIFYTLPSSRLYAHTERCSIAPSLARASACRRTRRARTRRSLGKGKLPTWPSGGAASRTSGLRRPTKQRRMRMKRRGRRSTRRRRCVAGRVNEFEHGTHDDVFERFLRRRRPHSRQ